MKVRLTKTAAGRHKVESSTTNRLLVALMVIGVVTLGFGIWRDPDFNYTSAFVSIIGLIGIVSGLNEKKKRDEQKNEGE